MDNNRNNINMKKLICQFRNWMEKFSRAFMTVLMLIIALLITFLVILTG